MYAQQPTAFLAFWKQVYTAINANVLSQGKVAMIWAPSYALGYPFAGGAYSIASTTSADFKLLDTNHDGVLNGLDDPYSPYYPGDSFVDWVGLSTYYFGLTFPWINNQLPPAGQFSNILSGENGFGGSNFYATYCATGGQKPFFVTGKSLVNFRGCCVIPYGISIEFFGCFGTGSRSISDQTGILAGMGHKCDVADCISEVEGCLFV